MEEAEQIHELKRGEKEENGGGKKAEGGKKAKEKKVRRGKVSIGKEEKNV